ncbi:MAG: AsmA-like C-terminal region-containing protein [Opitutaceae bacterium]|jgi:hypothetical protein
MRSWPIFYRASIKFCLHCMTSFLVWASWTALGLLLLIQAWIAVSHELVLPAPLLRMVEHHLSQSGMTIRLGQVFWDPSGQLVVRDFAVILDSFNEPIVKGSLLHTRIDPWGMIVGDPNAHQLELSGVEVLLPAPVSPSGRTEAYVKDLNALLYFQDRELEIGNLTALFGGIFLSAHGSVQLDAWRRARSESDFTWDAALGRVIAAMRQLALVYPKLDVVQGAKIGLELTPSESRGAIAEASITAEALHLPAPYECATGPLHIVGRFPISGDSPVMTRITMSVQNLATPEFNAQTLQATVRGMLHPASFSFEPREADLAAASVESHGVTIKAPSARMEAGPLPILRFTLAAGLADGVVDVAGTVNTSTRSGALHVAATPTNDLLEVASSKSGVNLKRYVQFSGAAHVEGDLEFAPGGKLQIARGWVEADRFSIQGVPLDHIKGDLLWDGRQFHGTEAVLRQGNNIARGSYWMDAATRDYRFLLSGGMQPMDISEWFTGWWPALWRNFGFEAALPDADIDIIGRWRSPALSRIFVGADVAKPVVSTVAFEKANVQLFILPNYVHALALHAFRTEGEATSWFVRTYNPAAEAWRRIDFDIHSTLDPRQCARIFAPTGPELVDPFFFAKAPKVHGRGHLDGPGAPGGLSHSVEIDIDSKGEFQMHGFPLEDLNCFVFWDDRNIEIDKASARFAQGTVVGKIAIRQKGSDRRLSFEGSLKNARLADAIQISETYASREKGAQAQLKPVATDKALDSRLDVTLNAEGIYGDPLSMHGAGQAQLSGGELGEVRLLGLLSQLLRFTTLRFTTASGPFTIDGKHIDFPSIRIKGKNSAIEAHGRYSLENKTLDFNAKVWPFEESQNLIQGAIGLVLSPFSNALEVKLEGTLSNPAWSFANNPFRTRVNPEEESQVKPERQTHQSPPPSESPGNADSAPHSSSKPQDKD